MMRILKTCKFLEGIGYRITYLPVDEYGLIHIRELERSLTKETILVSIMMANFFIKDNLIHENKIQKNERIFYLYTRFDLFL